jgi:hypothetical protein
MADQQKEIFDAIKSLSLDVDGLKGYVQNDFDQLLSDGYTTKAEIADAAERAAENFDRCSSRLLDLRTQVLALMAKHSAPSSEEP